MSDHTIVIIWDAESKKEKMDSDWRVTVHGFGAVCGVVVVFAKTRFSNGAKSYQNKGKRPEIVRFQVFLVEISGIEPLTS